MKDGDRNSKFFHISLTVRRCKNKIQVVKSGHERIYNEEGIKDYFINNFTDLYQSNFLVLTEEIGEIGEKVISKQENVMILAIPSAEEMKNCVNKLHQL